jgi:hypothetical protein
MQNGAANQYVVNRPASMTCGDFAPTKSTVSALQQQCLFNAGVCAVVSAPESDSATFMNMLKAVPDYSRAACRMFASCWPAVDPDVALLRQISCRLPARQNQFLILTLPSGVNLPGMVSQPSGTTRLDEYALPDGIVGDGALFDACGPDGNCGTDDDVVGLQANDEVAIAELMSKHQTADDFMVTHDVSIG